MPAKRTPKRATKNANRGERAAAPARRGRKKIGTNYTVRLPDELRAKVRSVSDAHGTSEAAVIRRACESFVRQVEAGQELADIEEKISATLSRAHRLAVIANQTADRNNDNIQILIALIDQLARFVFMAAPEIINRDAAQILGKSRYDTFVGETAKSFVAGGKAARVAAQIKLSLASQGSPSDNVEADTERLPNTTVKKE